MSIIRIKNLKKYFGHTRAVDGISFDVEEGEIYGYLGPNGAGKTTTIRCMMDLLSPDDGMIEIFGQNAHEHSAMLKKDIGFLSGEVALYEKWTGQEHIDVIRSIRGGRTRENALIDILRFDTSKKVSDLSSGNKQKLGLILALMHSPKLLILDEPTLGLDPLLQEAIHTLLREEAAAGKTVFFSSHNLPEVEKLCDRVCIIKDGKVVSVESVADLRKKRLYTVYITFAEDVPESTFTKNGFIIETHQQNTFHVTVKGNIGEFIEKIKSYQIRDLEITHARLEDIFLEYYQ